MWTVSINDAELEAAGADAQATLESGVQSAVTAATDTAEDFVRETAKRHRRSGAMGDNIKRTTGHLTGEVTADVNHASFLDGGTKPHRIEPKAGGVLRFTVGGRTVFTPHGVDHPGTTGIGFKAEAERRAQATLDRATEAAAERAADVLRR